MLLVTCPPPSLADEISGDGRDLFFAFAVGWLRRAIGLSLLLRLLRL